MGKNFRGNSYDRPRRCEWCGRLVAGSKTEIIRDALVCFTCADSDAGGIMMMDQEEREESIGDDDPVEWYGRRSRRKI